MKALGGAGENRTTTRFGLAANGNDTCEKLTRLEDIEDGLRPVFGNVDPSFAHHCHHERIERPGLQAGALSFELSATDIV